MEQYEYTNRRNDSCGKKAAHAKTLDRQVENYKFINAIVIWIAYSYERLTFVNIA